MLYQHITTCPDRIQFQFRMKEGETVTLGKLLRCIREEQKMSQEAFGALFNRCQKDISFYEADRVSPTKEFLNAVAAQTNDDVLAAYICGERDRDWIRSAVQQAIKTGGMKYA